MEQFNEKFATKAEAEAFAEKMNRNPGYTNYVLYSYYYNGWKVDRMKNQNFISEEILSLEKIEQMAKDIYNFLVEHDMWEDVAIYFNGKVWNTHGVGDNGEDICGDGKTIHERRSDPNIYFEYVRDPHILSMSFEGDLYEALNYGDGRIYEKLQDVIRKYVANDPDYGECKCYFELGEAWNLSVSY